MATILANPKSCTASISVIGRLVGSTAENEGSIEYMLDINGSSLLVRQHAIDFVVLPASSTAVASKPSGFYYQRLAGSRKQNHRDAFDPPDSSLLVWPRSQAYGRTDGCAEFFGLEATHMVVMNKYPVSQMHMLVVRQPFQSQMKALDTDDFRAAIAVASSIARDSSTYGADLQQHHDGASWGSCSVDDHGDRPLIFFNGGPAASATYPRRHLQVVSLACAMQGLRESDTEQLHLPVEIALARREAAVESQFAEPQVDSAAIESSGRGYIIERDLPDGIVRLPQWQFAHAASRLPAAATRLLGSTSSEPTTAQIASYAKAHVVGNENGDDRVHKLGSAAGAINEQDLRAVSKQVLGLYQSVLQAAIRDADAQALDSCPKMDWVLSMGPIPEAFGRRTGEWEQGQSRLVSVPQHSLIMTPDWMVVVLRSKKAHRGIPVAGPSYAGLMLALGEAELKVLGVSDSEQMPDRDTASGGARRRVDLDAPRRAGSETGSSHDAIGPVGVLTACGVDSSRVPLLEHPAEPPDHSMQRHETPPAGQ